MVTEDRGGNLSEDAKGTADLTVDFLSVPEVGRQDEVLIPVILLQVVIES